jgi:DeoR/GlpR family transcriptional regulator of sugar metabolism
MLRIEMAKNAKRRVLLCDSSKMGTASTFKLFPLSSVEFLITDKAAPSELVEKFKLTLITNTPAYIYSVSK